MNATTRIEALRQLGCARLREWKAAARLLAEAAARLLAEAFPERQALIRELGRRLTISRLGRGPQIVLAASATISTGWAIAVVIGLIFGGPAPRAREFGTVVAVKLDPAPKPPVAGSAAAGLDFREDEAALREEFSGEAAEDEIEGLFAADAIAWDSLALTEVLEPPAAASPEPVPAPSRSVEAGQSCRGEHEPEQRPVREDAALGRLRAQLGTISERVFALATRGLGAPAPAEVARSAKLPEEGEAAALAQMEGLERHVDRLATGVTALRSAETELVREIQPQLAYFIATAERVIQRAGMDLDDVFQDRAKPKRPAEGGPFIAAVSGPMAAERAALQSDLAYWQALRALVRRMPLAAPLDRYAISSSYGTRRDPINSRQAVHHGLDLITAANAPIRAPAPGIVVFAGRNGGYGNMVEIDHGRSLRTRYAHLKTIGVKAGDKVEFQEKLGSVGNSGRSTGAHLHYEILIAGKPADPLNFIKAGQHVFQE